MPKRISTLSLALTLFSSSAAAQRTSTVQNDRIVLEQILTQTYQPSQVGKQLMGIGGETDIRRAGTIVVIQRPGLFGSLTHAEPASSAIDGLQYKLFRGHQDYEVPAGERFYVTAVAVGSDTVLVAMISARSISTQAGTGRMWTTLSFKFPANVLATADKETVFREFDQWLMPEGRATSATPVAAPPAPAAATYPAAAPVAIAVPQPAAASRPAPPSESALTPGMTREQILQAMGKPDREIQFEQRQWMVYPGFVATLKDNKLESFESSGAGATKVTVQSDPPGAEIYLDDQFVGSTPSILSIAPGKHAFRLHASGRADWSRQLNVQPGSDVTLAATLDKN
ncbi:MAG TPA: PEGA domain-containing protein [Candidatus Limnocylindrales bacterium]|nr:PEGA domain-containing protein [Candidatus Limnocylindrales bacterium]